jgi:hypothetical protein
MFLYSHTLHISATSPGAVGGANHNENLKSLQLHGYYNRLVNPTVICIRFFVCMHMGGLILFLLIRLRSHEQFSSR